MTQEERIDLLTQVATGMAKLMGEDTEIILHDLTTRKVVYMFNNEISGRDYSYRINPAVYDVINKLADGDGHLIGYATKSASGRMLRSSHFMFTDEENRPAAMICINQDIAKMQQVIDYLQKMIDFNKTDEEYGLHPKDLPGENYIKHVAVQAANEILASVDPKELATKKGKMEVLRLCKQKGLLEIRDAIPHLAAALSISQATLYNYLREIRTEEEQRPINGLKLR